MTRDTDEQNAYRAGSGEAVKAESDKDSNGPKPPSCVASLVRLFCAERSDVPIPTSCRLLAWPLPLYMGLYIIKRRGGHQWHEGVKQSTS